MFFNRSVRRRGVVRLYAAISRLGDGVFWYTLMLMLPVFHGVEAWGVSLHMLVVGAVALVVYKLLKTGTLRDRPCSLRGGLARGVAPLDQYSFPSGHTLHAVVFTTVVVAHFPVWGIVLIPFTLLVALSRLVLGLHYPSDVAAGAVIGAAMAGVSLDLVTAAQAWT